jgi:hypothetical protein
MKPERLLKDAYSEKTRCWMKAFYDRLSEKDRRSYAALEAQKLGHGGVKLVCELFGCSREILRKGLQELEDPGLMPSGERIRHPGAGRKGVLYEHADLEAKLNAILEHNIAGDPMNEHVKWTHLNARQIQQQLADQGVELSENTVRELLKKKSLSNVSLKKESP